MLNSNRVSVRRVAGRVRCGAVGGTFIIIGLTPKPINLMWQKGFCIGGRGNNCPLRHFYNEHDGPMLQVCADVNLVNESIVISLF